MKQNNPYYLFGMYEPDTDSVIVNAINNTYTSTPREHPKVCVNLQTDVR